MVWPILGLASQPKHKGSSIETIRAFSPHNGDSWVKAKAASTTTVVSSTRTLAKGNRLNASLARFSEKLEDRKSKQIKSNLLNNGEASKNISRSVDNQLKPRLKRVLWFVEEEALKKLKKCLIDTMETLCNTCQVDDHLQTWGLNNFTIKDIGGCRFIIEVQLDELEHTLHPKQSTVPLQSKDKKRVEYSSESSSDSFSGSNHSTAHANRSRNNYFEEDEMAKAICLEKKILGQQVFLEVTLLLLRFRKGLVKVVWSFRVVGWASFGLKFTGSFLGIHF
ncbi:hypothetical protein V6N11_025178 [Hibiscus sabdariffa]|uniref:Uncharacterized protein n=1 Tax=Hibiscus sabdariffa TaxID=183260 RepID=A0ABR2QP98_9ROSI